MLELIFNIMLFLGTIVPMNEKNDEREMYYLHFPSGEVIEHVYKEEVYLYINTGEFKYDESYMYP